MAAEALTDQEKQFRKRARRRLVGAVALVLLMVTVLPMLLDDRSDQAPRPDVAISIPSQDGGDFSSKIVPAPPTAVAPVVALPAPADSTVQLPPPPAEPTVLAVEEVKPEAQPQPAPEARVEKAEPAAKPTKKIEPKPKAEPASVEKNIEASKSESVSIQIGVFSDSDKVTQIKSKMASLGLKCGTEPLNTKTGVKVRMRCGPYAAKAEAERAQEALKAAGFNNSILVTHQ